MSHPTQIIACTERPTQVLGSLKGLDVYLFPHTPAGSVVCERTSEAIDVRIIVQVTRGISWTLGRGPAVLAFAGNEGTGFWCGLFEGGELRFEHNRLTGPSDFTENPASSAEIEALCGHFGPEVDREAVRGILTEGQSMSALDRHAALVRTLGLPGWLPGVGYARILEGRVPSEAGAPKRPPRSLRELGDAVDLPEKIAAPDSLTRFHRICERAFSFLKKDFGFRNLKPGYRNSYMRCYRSRHLIVVIEGLSYGGRTRLCLIDPNSQYLDLTELVKRRNPELLDLCRLADGQSEQIPMFAETFRKCGSDVLAGDLSAIGPLREVAPGFSFSAFSSQADGDYILALYGPVWEQMRGAVLLNKIKARLWGRP